MFWILGALGALLFVHLLLVVAIAEISVHPPVVRRTCDTNCMAMHVAVTMGAQAELVTMKSSDGLTLSAWWLRLPSFEASHKAALLCHGVADTAFGVMGAALLYLRHGYSVLAPDSRGHGGSRGFVSYGIREALDIAGWQRWLTERGVEDCVGFGESLGASSLLMSLKAGARFSSIVGECAFSTFRRAAWDRGLLVHRLFLPMPVAAALCHLWVEEILIYLRLRYGVNLDEARPIDAITGDTPILLIHGTGDFETPIHHSQQIVAAYPGQVQLWPVEGAQHTGAYALAPGDFEARIISHASTQK